jgi:5'-nucleotidase / UDP-sugar diphosphatase
MKHFASFLSKSIWAASVASLALTPSLANAAVLTLIHNNDGESRLLAVSGQTGASRFVTAVNQIRDAATTAGRDVITVSSGDNFLAGPVFKVSQDSGVFYDAQVLSAIKYDAIVLGNHEFDFGPNTLAAFVDQVDSTIPYLSANLDFSGEASLQALVNSGRIAKSTIITRGSEKYGIVGATTDELPTISSPGNVVVNAVVSSVQAEIDSLTAQGVNKIIFASHLQRPDIDVATIAQLKDVDIVVAGGSDLLLSNTIAQGGTDSFGQAVFGPYPLVQFNGINGFSGPSIVDADGKQIPIVTTSGEYRYVGVLNATFDNAGVLTSIDTGSGPVTVNNTFANDPGLEASVIAPVTAAVQSLANNIIATVQNALNGLNANIRTGDTNLGHVFADALRWQAGQLDLQDDSVLSGNPVIALQNGGGIRGNRLYGQNGQLTELNTFEIGAFTNFLSVASINATQLKALMEHALGALPAASGRFAQISGFIVRYDPNRASGDRISEILLADGTPVWGWDQALYNGQLDLVTIDFLLNGGDAYPFSALGITGQTYLDTTYQQALFNFITSQDGLNGEITNAAYPGFGRIVDVPEPAVLGLFGLGAFGLMLARRKRKAA